MTDYITDDEQVERIKKWWTDNGSSIIAGLVLGIGGLFGWQYWTDYKANQAAEASAQFTGMLNHAENQQNDEAIARGYTLIEEYGSTVYAQMARLTLARIFAETGEYDKSEQQLRMVLDARPDIAVEMIVRKRLGLVLLQQDKLEQALAVVAVEFPPHFAASFEELKGDIMAAQGNIEQAREAYQRARLAQPGAAHPEFLQQKIDDLG